MITSPLNAIARGVVTHSQFASIDGWANRKLLSTTGVALTPVKIEKVSHDQRMLTGTIDIEFVEQDQVQLKIGKEKVLGWTLEPGVYKITGEVHIRIPQPGLIASVEAYATASLAGIEILPVMYSVGTDSVVEFLIKVNNTVDLPQYTNIAELQFRLYEVPQVQSPPKKVGAGTTYDNSRSFI